MTREELKEHCERQIQQFERVEKIMPVTLNDWKRYEEHKLILELLEQEPILDKIRVEIEQIRNDPLFNVASNEVLIAVVLEIINKYKAERSEEDGNEK